MTTSVILTEQTMTETTNKYDLRQFAFEFSIVAVLALFLWIFFSRWLYPLLDLPSAAPMPARTILMLLVVFALIRKSGDTWSSFGLSKKDKAWRIVLLALVFFSLKLFIIQPIGDVVVQGFGLSKSNTSMFNHIQGNPLALAAWISIAWVAGGFAEEFIFRGFLMGRIAKLCSYSVTGWGMALAGQAILFGALHFYLGLAGVVSATVAALAYGIFFLIAGKNLWPIIIVHAVWDSLGFILIFQSGISST